MEMLYKVDRNDRVLGKVDRSIAHKEGILHRSGIVFLFNKAGKVLVTYRSKEKETFPGRYDASVAFHVKYGETYKEAAERELEEETGIRAKVHYVGKFVHHDEPEHEFVAVFVAESNNRVRLDRSESESGNFITKEEADSIIANKKVTPWFKLGWQLFREKERRRQFAGSEQTSEE